MIKSRIIEEKGVIGEITIESYDKLMKDLMKKGYLDTSAILKSGIVKGLALEIGPGPGCL